MNRPTYPDADTVQLKEVQPGIVSVIRKKYDEFNLRKYGTLRGPGLYREDDWARLYWAYHRLPKKETILDVGVGAGQFFNLLHLSNQFEHVVGIDLKKHSKFISLSDNLDFRVMSVANLQLEDKSFDTVICMEVLEHINHDDFISAISELRRVAKRKLLVTVPFQEPEPLPKHHKSRFDIETVNHHFPKAKKTLLFKIKRTDVPWLAIEEDFFQADAGGVI